MNNIKLAKEIFNVSHLTGEFKLRSGLISNEYFDKYLFESDPRLLNNIAEAMIRLIPEDTEILAGLEMGGIPIAAAISLKTGIPAVFVRKRAKDYGTCKLAEGMDIKDKRVCIVEDVVTTGGQIIISSKDLLSCGAKIQNVLCVIERDIRGREALAKEGLKLSALFTRQELKDSIV